jgi:mRNA interferase RelE/StbE
MIWRIELDKAAERDLDKLDPQIARRILRFLHDRVASLDDPRSIGEALKGSRLGEFWKYRVGDYRIISSIEDEAVRILVVEIGNRRKIYRQQCLEPLMDTNEH